MNNSEDPATVRAWLVFTLTDGSEITTGTRLLTLDPNQTQHYPIHPIIPAGYDPGQYQVTVRVGTYPVATDEYGYPFWIE